MYSREELKQLKVDFWQLFGKRCDAHPELKFRKRKWMLHKTKIKGVALRFDVSRTDAKVILELGNKNEKLRLKAYEILERYKVIIEEGFQNGLEWEFYHEREDSGAAVCRIFTQLNDVDFHRQNQWPDIFNFYIENMLKLESNFLQIRDLLQEELKN
ncbi:DUF4268 domain-containing protein [Draconibacterium sp. IB214405]|uniref:DUF4268 domain-containing protein n=1 Tax=Draconibacterium sp. IB214405 TaxID=3097352 RepID=UPI002A165D8C|nr:DUF4268 domain-containing protein [Draconibacterium sp. IB214405]MDX8339669.1 DUF4268 domain-containing protein [Draconibacterium sp. IB214405]